MQCVFVLSAISMFVLSAISVHAVQTISLISSALRMITSEVAMNIHIIMRAVIILWEMWWRSIILPVPLSWFMMQLIFLVVAVVCLFVCLELAFRKNGGLFILCCFFAACLSGGEICKWNTRTLLGIESSYHFWNKSQFLKHASLLHYVCVLQVA